jgi:hypothetical protein
MLTLGLACDSHRCVVALDMLASTEWGAAGTWMEWYDRWMPAKTVRCPVCTTQHVQQRLPISEY